jgi:enoyl-CoA hydratase/3-hydroxyacyl-CoA dehydrogenase
VRAGTKIGLPELSLGVIPGFGGTQRLPRLIGLQKALMMMLTSQPISEKEALMLGLLDAVVAPEDLVNKAREMALDMATGRAFRKVTIDYTGKLEPLAEAEAIFAFTREEATKRAGEL